MKKLITISIMCLLFTMSKANDTTHLIKARNNAIASIGFFAIGTYLAYDGAISQDRDASAAGFFLMTAGAVFGSVSMFHYVAHNTNVRLTPSTLSVAIRF